MFFSGLSLFSSFLPFLNSLIAFFNELAISGRRFAPKSKKMIKKVSNSSIGPGIANAIVESIIFLFFGVDLFFLVLKRFSIRFCC